MPENLVNIIAYRDIKIFFRSQAHKNFNFFADASETKSAVTFFLKELQENGANLASRMGWYPILDEKIIADPNLRKEISYLCIRMRYQITDALTSFFQCLP